MLCTRPSPSSKLSPYPLILFTGENGIDPATVPVIVGKPESDDDAAADIVVLGVPIGTTAFIRAAAAAVAATATTARDEAMAAAIGWASQYPRRGY